MKKIKLILTTAAVLVGSTSYVGAQRIKNPWGINIGSHAVDFKSVQGPFKHYYKTGNWDIVYPLSKLSLIHNSSNHFSTDITGSIGRLVDNKRLGLKDKLFVNAGLGLRFNILGSNSWFDPYIRLGANYHRYDYRELKYPLTAYGEKGTYLIKNEKGKIARDHITLSGGLGLNLWFSKNVGLNLSSEYNHIPVNGRKNDFDFMQHSAGLTFRFGAKQDSDGDGIIDKDDACPHEKGLKEHKGCPDSDGDGIIDKDDACPHEKGPKEHKGCPDSDGDGIIDKDDACPHEKGSKDNNGCPLVDSDGDGVLDKDDACPHEKGSKDNNGCPLVDSDGDGVLDKDDACPHEKGPKDNNGCPWKEVNVSKKLSKILFEFNSDRITSDSYSNVENAAEMLNSDELKNKKFYIDGHADQRGKAAYNKSLSLKRAKSIVKELVDKGVSSSRLTPRGLGSSHLLCKENTEECYQMNRRVEVLQKNTAITHKKVIKKVKKNKIRRKINKYKKKPIKKK